MMLNQLSKNLPPRLTDFIEPVNTYPSAAPLLARRAIELRELLRRREFAARYNTRGSEFYSWLLSRNKR